MDSNTGDNNNFTRTQIFGTVFETPSNRYTNLQPVGMGAFGLVCSAVDNYSFVDVYDEETGKESQEMTSKQVAIKKIMKPFSTSVLAKRTYRELKLMSELRHENLISLEDIYVSPWRTFTLLRSYWVLTFKDCYKPDHWKSSLCNTFYIKFLEA